jgi:hypothetical protein
MRRSRGGRATSTSASCCVEGVLPGRGVDCRRIRLAAGELGSNGRDRAVRKVLPQLASRCGEPSDSPTESDEASEVAAVGGAGTAGERECDRLDLFVLDVPFASRQQYERKRGAGGADDRGDGEPTLEPMRQRDWKRRASVKRVVETGCGDGRENRQPERSADLLRRVEQA